MCVVSSREDSSVGMATRYGLDGPRIDSRRGEGARFSEPVETGPPTLLYTVYRIFRPGINRPGRGVDHLSPPRAEVKERVELYIYSPFGSSWPLLG